MTTWCSECDNVHPSTRKEAPWHWRCMAAPIVENGYRFVDPSYSPNPPYEKCDRVNGIGECPAWTPRREAPPKEEKKRAPEPVSE